MAATALSAFTPTTGLPALDDVLAGIQRGDNIVWQIESLDEYVALVRPYVEAARRQRRRLISTACRNWPMPGSRTG